MVKYRILERRTNGSWPPFGVAYERDGRIVLFTPPWRADRTLAAASLEELDERYCPSAEFRWQAVQGTSEAVEHPIEWLQRALDAEQADVSIPERLATALKRVASARQDLFERLTVWRDQVERGVSCAEACLRMALTIGRAGTMEVLCVYPFRHPGSALTKGSPALLVE